MKADPGGQPGKDWEVTQNISTCMSKYMKAYGFLFLCQK